MKELLPFVPFDATPSSGWLANLLGGLAADKNVLLYWTLPLLAVVAVSCALGAGGMWLMARRKSDERKARETGTGAYRGVTVSLGVLPTPHSLPRDELDLSAEDNELLARMTDKELRLLTDILGTLSAHPEAYPGEGVTVSTSGIDPADPLQPPAYGRQEGPQGAGCLHPRRDTSRRGQLGPVGGGGGMEGQHSRIGGGDRLPGREALQQGGHPQGLQGSDAGREGHP